MRASGTLDGSKVFGHGSVSSLAVHVFSRSPVRPCTKIRLGRKTSANTCCIELCVPSQCLLAKANYDFRPTYSTVLFSPSCSIFIPKGEGFRKEDDADAALDAEFGISSSEE